MVSILTVLMAGMFGSPDEPQLTIKAWAANAGDNFYATAVQELAGTSESAGYGPPYNTAGTGSVRRAAGPSEVVRRHASGRPGQGLRHYATALSTAAGRCRSSPQALGRGQPRPAGRLGHHVRHCADRRLTTISPRSPGDYGPVPTLAKGLTAMAVSGALDGVLMAQGGFYQTDFTKQILFLGDGSYLDDAATAAHLQGNTWGMMNETGSYPGPGMAVAVLLLVPDSAVQLRQPRRLPHQPRGCHHLLHHGRTVARTLVAPLRTRPEMNPPFDPLHRLIWQDYYHPQSTNTSSTSRGLPCAHLPIARHSSSTPSPARS